MSNLFQRTLQHIEQGTLPQRLYERYHDLLYQRRAAQWAHLSSSREHLTMQIHRGLKIRLYSNSRLAGYIYSQAFEMAERHFLRAFLRPNDIFVDIGANIGLFTLIAAERVESTGAVYAFEPSSDTFHRLRENVDLNSLTHVQCYQAALSDQAAQLPLTVALNGWEAWNSLAHPTAGDRFTTEEVPCIIWDSFAAQHDLIGKVTMMKIDVEGWETRVLAGATQVLSRDDAPILQVEFTEAAAQAAGSSCQALYSQITELGYGLYRYEPVSQTLIPDPLRNEYPYVNLIAVKQLGPALARLCERTRYV